MINKCIVTMAVLFSFVAMIIFARLDILPLTILWGIITIIELGLLLGIFLFDDEESKGDEEK